MYSDKKLPFLDLLFFVWDLFLPEVGKIGPELSTLSYEAYSFRFEGSGSCKSGQSDERSEPLKYSSVIGLRSGEMPALNILYLPIQTRTFLRP